MRCAHHGSPFQPTKNRISPWQLTYEGVVAVRKIDTKLNPADLLTKPLPKSALAQAKEVIPGEASDSKGEKPPYDGGSKVIG